jgi:hypothetical protein
LRVVKRHLDIQVPEIAAVEALRDTPDRRTLPCRTFPTFRFSPTSAMG